MYEFFILVCIYLTVISLREIFYLLFYLHHGKGLLGSAWHSVSHIIVLTLVPMISWHTVLFSESYVAIGTLLAFMSFTELHMKEERAEYFAHMNIKDILTYIRK